MASVKSARRVRRRPRARVTTDQLVAAAVTIVNREGAAALSIRRLAEECQLTPMAIYRHVRDKDDLLDRVVEAAITTSLPHVNRDGAWQERVRNLFRGMRQTMLEHPGVAMISVSRPTPVAAVARFYEEVIGTLLDGGCSAVEAVHAFDTLLLFTFGSVLWQIPRADTERERLVRRMLQEPDQAPQLLEHAATLVKRDPLDYFEYGLEVILTGLQSRLSLNDR